MWDDLGFLKNIGAVDAGGSGVVHLTGGFSGKISCFYLFKKYLKTPFCYLKSLKLSNYFVNAQK